jgi:hypothetical protein
MFRNINEQWLLVPFISMLLLLVVVVVRVFVFVCLFMLPFFFFFADEELFIFYVFLDVVNLLGCYSFPV